MTALYKLGAPSTSVCVDQSGSNWNGKKGAKLAKRLFERVTPMNRPIVSLFLFSTYHKNFQISLHGINYETSHFWSQRNSNRMVCPSIRLWFGPSFGELVGPSVCSSVRLFSRDAFTFWIPITPPDSTMTTGGALWCSGYRTDFPG